MNSFDIAIIKYLNQFSQHSWRFDWLLVMLCENNLIKGGVLIAIVWWVWSKNDKPQSLNREHIILTFISCIITMAFARGLALTLPFRFRPMHEKSLNFLVPYGMSAIKLEGWSSFPSDHAALFFAISTGLFFISRRIGIFALAYTLLFISFPRIYMGIHYPTDILAGALIGISISLISNMCLLKDRHLQSITNWSYAKPAVFYPLFFLFTYQIADLFQGSRHIISLGFRILFNKPIS